MAYRNSSLGMPGRIAHMRALCASEPGPGVLAYVEGEVAGWCSVAPNSTYRALVNSRTIPHVGDDGAWSVVCFVVRPAFGAAAGCTTCWMARWTTRTQWARPCWKVTRSTLRRAYRRDQWIRRHRPVL